MKENKKLADNKKKNKKLKKENGYFTVEATLLMPLALGVILVMVYLLLYQYDRCILEQDIGRLALRGCVQETCEGETLGQKIASVVSDVDEDIYIGWQRVEQRAALDDNEFTVLGEGVLMTPFGKWWSDKLWDARALYSYDRMDEVGFVRLCNRITGPGNTKEK